MPGASGKAMDGGSVARVEEQLRRFMAQGGSIVLVTHDTGQVARLAQDTLRMAPA